MRTVTPIYRSIIICLLIATHLFDGNCQSNVWEESWTSCQKTQNPIISYGSTHWIMYEFHSRESVTDLMFWNANRTGTSTQGINQIAIDYYDDDSTWKNLGTFHIPKGPEADEYAGFQGPSLEGKFISKLLITVLSTHGDQDCASVAELKINIDNGACYGIIDECGICDGGGMLLWFEDADGDGLGNIDEAIYNCDEPNGYVENSDDLCDNGIMGWEEIGALFIDNGCIGCHFPGGLGGLDLTTYETFIQGGTKCGPNILSGSTLVDIILIPGYDGCSETIGIPNMNARVGDAMDANEIAAIGKWINDGYPEHCQCPSGAPDTDLDGVCDAMDYCPAFDNRLIGSTCDDGDPCTMNDQIGADCNCLGTQSPDSDQDGVCDIIDLLPDNPCSADGTIDGIEPYNWISRENNDCDNDGINIANGDIDDFQACIDDKGFLNTAFCTCGENAVIANGNIIKIEGEIANVDRAIGIPDSLQTGSLTNGDRITLQFPAMRKGEEICITVGFQSIETGIAIGMNGLGNYHFFNEQQLIDFAPQEFCFKTIEDGPQTITLIRLGTGGLRIDGSTYPYCPCSGADPFIFSPDCACPNNSDLSTTTFESQVGFNDAERAEGFPDSLLTGLIGNGDTLNLNFEEIYEGSKICVTAGFNNVDGGILISLGNTVASFTNLTDSLDYYQQEFCFAIHENLSDATLRITKLGPGAMRIDGVTASFCIPCQSGDVDSDGDGICDLNDRCSLSASNDSDGDRVCDDIDICLGFDDMTDSDGDGIPDGCDLCNGFPDELDEDGDGVPDECDRCPGNDDSQDFDNDGLPDACDPSPCVNFILANEEEAIITNKVASINITTNSTIPSASDVLFQAGHSIDFLQGFSVEANTLFTADIAICN